MEKRELLTQQSGAYGTHQLPAQNSGAKRMGQSLGMGGRELGRLEAPYVMSEQSSHTGQATTPIFTKFRVTSNVSFYQTPLLTLTLCPESYYVAGCVLSDSDLIDVGPWPKPVPGTQ